MAKVSAVILIYDIRGFTAASKKLQSGELGAFATAAHRSILELFAARPPTFVKNLGDGHLLIWETTPEPDQELVKFVVSTAARARAVFPAFVAGQLEQPDKQGLKLPSRVGIGVAVGEVSRSDDYYGVVVNLAARLQNMARPEGLALDQPTFGMAGKREELVKRGFRKARVSLKGLGTTLVWVDRPFSWERLLRSLWPLYVAILAPLLYLLLADVAYDLPIPGGKSLRDWLDRHELSVRRTPESDLVIRKTADRDRRKIADALLKARLPDGQIATQLRNLAGGSSVWGSSQAITGLLAAPHLDAATKRQIVVDYGGHLFSEGVFIPGYGWKGDPKEHHTLAEPSLWTISMLARALGTPDVIPDEQRSLFEQRLKTAQEAVRIYHPLDTGGWNIFPNQKELDRYSPYSTTLALMALLETRAAGLSWDGSIELRDRLLEKSAQFLISLYEEQNGFHGWRQTANSADPISEGLTLQIYAELLQAEKLAKIALPPPMLEQIALHLGSLWKRKVSAYDAGEFIAEFTNHEQRTELQKESINFLWHSWAIEAAVRWLGRPQTQSVPRERIVAVRRALGYLVMDMSEEKTNAAVSGMSFVAGETLLGLSSVPPP